MSFPETPEDWFPPAAGPLEYEFNRRRVELHKEWVPGYLSGGDRLAASVEEAGAVLDALGAVEREAKRRRAGHQPDRRFDLALDVLGDLAELLAED